MLYQLRSQIDAWWHDTPIPTFTSVRTKPAFQKWHHFIQGNWTTFSGEYQTRGASHQWAGSLKLVSWNVNAEAPSSRSRISALLRVIETKVETDVIFLQEVSKNTLTTLLLDPWIQQAWYTSEADYSSFGKQSFATVTLISKTCLVTHSISLGSVWRVPLPSRFERDALCCDLIINPTSERSTRIRLINVHLDSLPINPSRRPQQLSIVSLYLQAAGQGLVAGDFNPVLPEDDNIISSNNLIDAWSLLYPTDPGFTWGVDGDGSFPANRLDKVALLNITPSSMQILRTFSLSSDDTAGILAKDPISEVQISDHYGLVCEFCWTEDR